MVNLPFTVLLGFVLLYWGMVALGILDLDLFGGTDADLDGDLEAHHGAGEVHGMNKEVSAHHAGFWPGALDFINVGKVPVMFVVSVLVLCLWLGSLLANRYLTGGSPILALILIVPNLAVAVVAARYVTLPFRPLFRVLTKDRDEGMVVLGQRCTIVTSEATPDFGQAEIRPADAPPILLNVRTIDGSNLRKGDLAVVVRADPERGIHFITPLA